MLHELGHCLFFLIQSLLVRIGITEVFPPNPIMPFSENDTTEDLELWQYCTGDPKYKDFCILTGVEEIMVSTKFSSNLYCSISLKKVRLFSSFAPITLERFHSRKTHTRMTAR